MDMMHTICLRCGKPAVSIPVQYDELGMKLSYTHYSYCEKCLRDGLKMLKEQEPVKPIKSKLSFTHGFNWDIWDCGCCGNQLRSFAKYCDQCGRAVKFDG